MNWVYSIDSWYKTISNVLRFVGFVAYYGHASNTSNLGSNMHLSFVFAALVEIPTFSIPFIINYFGRRWTLFVCFLTSGAMSIFYVSTPSGRISIPKVWCCEPKSDGSKRSWVSCHAMLSTDLFSLATTDVMLLQSLTIDFRTLL